MYGLGRAILKTLPRSVIHWLSKREERLILQASGAAAIGTLFLSCPIATTAFVSWAKAKR